MTALTMPHHLRGESALDADTRLMLRVAGDEPEAFAVLVQRYWSRVFGRLQQVLGDRQEAEDLAQDVFLRVYRHRRRYRPTAQFSTWLFHIVGNVARNAARRRRRKPCQSFGRISDDASLLNSSFDTDASHSAERAEIAQRVRLAVAGLAQRQRTALEMQFRHCTHGEIADALAMTPKAAKSLLYRARLQLRECLLPLQD